MGRKEEKKVGKEEDGGKRENDMPSHKSFMGPSFVLK